MGIFSAAIASFSKGGVGEPKATILVIDDDPVLLQTVKSLLGKRGFNVVTSSSGPQGLDMLRNAASNIRVVVLDYRMPEHNGDETLKFIKQLSPNARVIGLTAVDLDSVPEAYLDEVDKLLTKPVIATELIGAIDEFLAEEQPASTVIES
jgi:CheY-like chemotaxis protein